MFRATTGWGWRWRRSCGFRGTASPGWAEALRRLQEAPLTEQQRFLLGECVQVYLPLDEEQRREFERLVATEPYKGVQAVNKTWYEKGVEKGVEKGQRELLTTMLEEQFGPLPSAVQERLGQWPPDRLTGLAKGVLKAKSLRELGLED
jgi:hypothetical protein